MIYFIQAELSGAIKIGKANDPEQRLATFRTASHEPLALLGTIPGGLAEERALHQRFAAFRLHGEWFVNSPALMKYIEELHYIPTPCLLTDAGMRAWAIEGGSGNDSTATAEEFFCVIPREILYPDPRKILERVRPGHSWYAIDRIEDVTLFPEKWNYDEREVRERIPYLKGVYRDGYVVDLEDSRLIAYCLWFPPDPFAPSPPFSKTEFSQPVVSIRGEES